jgi:Copper chaperone
MINLKISYMRKVTLKVKGMSCMGCAAKVKRAIEREMGKEVKVHLEDGKVEFLLENGNLEKILRSLEILGYPAEVEQN